MSSLINSKFIHVSFLSGRLFSSYKMMEELRYEVIWNTDRNKIKMKFDNFNLV